MEISLRIISADNKEEEVEREFIINLRRCLKISDLILFQRFGKIEYLGLLDFEQLKSDGIDVSLATDVGAGTSLSMLRTMGDAYKVCQLRGYSLSAMEAFAMSTLGNAQCLHLDKYIGNFEVGKEADFLMLDPNATDLSSRRTGLSETIEDELFVMMTIGDERTVVATYVEGNLTRQ